MMIKKASSLRQSPQEQIQELKSKVKARTLVIGSSVLKGIQTRGLKVCINRGPTTDDLFEVLNQWNISYYKNIIIHTGGNVYSNGDGL